MGRTKEEKDGRKNCSRTEGMKDGRTTKERKDECKDCGNTEGRMDGRKHRNFNCVGVKLFALIYCELWNQRLLPHGGKFQENFRCFQLL